MKNKLTQDVSRFILDNENNLSKIYYRFKATGQFDNGHLAYSRVDIDGNIIPEDESSYYQIRFRNMLVMVRV